MIFLRHFSGTHPFFLVFFIMKTRPSNPKRGEYVEGWSDKREDNPPISHKSTLSVPLSDRLQIIKKYENGVSIHKLASTFGRDRRTVRKFINLWKEKEDLSPLKSPSKIVFWLFFRSPYEHQGVPMKKRRQSSSPGERDLSFATKISQNE